MVERVEAQFDLTPNALSAIPLMAPPRCWPGWSKKRTSNRIAGVDKTERKDDSLSSNAFHWVRTPKNMLPSRQTATHEWRAFTQQRSR
uniref:hypothetical protein n=1 Tax=Escherichia coli TaxID=562 RepID=UPI003AF2878B